MEVLAHSLQTIYARFGAFFSDKNKTGGYQTRLETGIRWGIVKIYNTTGRFRYQCNGLWVQRPPKAINTCISAVIYRESMA